MIALFLQRSMDAGRFFPSWGDWSGFLEKMFWKRLILEITFWHDFEEGGFFLVLFKRRFISRNCNKFEEEESLLQMRLVVVKMI